MSLDRTKVLEAAQKFLAKGQYDRAIVEYRKLVQDDPKDVRTWLKIGDLYTRKGAKKEACDTYFRVAEQYAEQGFFLKAVAVYKQILKLDPARMDVTLRLAEMYEQLQLVSDALATYELVAQHHLKNGDTEKALAMLGRMADLDPENIALRIKHAEALSKAGNTDGAADALEAAATLLRDQGRIEEYTKVAERLLFHRPTQASVARDLARTYIDRKDPKRALAKLQVCYKASPQDLETLELLAEAFYLLGQTPKTISVYREMARLHQDAKHVAERASVLRRILDLDPSDADAKAALAAAMAQSGPRPPAAPPTQQGTDPHVEIVEDEELDEEDLEAAGPSVVPSAPAARIARGGASPPPPVPEAAKPVAYESSSPPAPADVPPLPAPPEDVSRLANVNRLLAECEVFMRYGLRAKVIAQLHKVLEIDPTHLATRLRLKNFFVEGGENDAAVEQLYAIVDLLEERDPSAARGYSDEIASLTGEAPPTVLSTETDVGVRPATAGPSPALGVPSAEPASGEVKEANDEDALAPMSPEEFDAVPVREQPVEESLPAPGAQPCEIDDVLDEVEFFVAQGLLAEARSALDDALSEHPSHPLLRDKLAELAAGFDSVVALEPAVPSVGTDAPPLVVESAAIAEGLREELDGAPSLGEGSGVLDLETVFAQFKKGVEETVPLEDSETHSDLGIAYKEMGLLDDAIHEFEVCLANPEKECAAHTMIGLCYVEKGDVADAISHFKKGLYSDHKSEQEELSLYFELGAAYELLHDPKEALYYYQKVHRRRPDFRSVGERIAVLGSPRSVPPKADPAPIGGDLGAAFDELVRDKDS